VFCGLDRLIQDEIHDAGFRQEGKLIDRHTAHHAFQGFQAGRHQACRTTTFWGLFLSDRNDPTFGAMALKSARSGHKKTDSLGAYNKRLLVGWDDAWIHP